MERRFESDQDIYVEEALADKDSQYACFRWLSRVVSKAGKRQFYADWLSELQVERLPDIPLAILKALLEEVPAARGFITDDRLALIDGAQPLTPPIVLEDEYQTHPYTFEKMGIIL